MREPLEPPADFTLQDESIVGNVTDVLRQCHAELEGVGNPFAGTVRDIVLKMDGYHRWLQTGLLERMRSYYSMGFWLNTLVMTGWLRNAEDIVSALRVAIKILVPDRLTQDLFRKSLDGAHSVPSTSQLYHRRLLAVAGANDFCISSGKHLY